MTVLLFRVQFINKNCGVCIIWKVIDGALWCQRRTFMVSKTIKYKINKDVSEINKTPILKKKNIEESLISVLESVLYRILCISDIFLSHQYSWEAYRGCFCERKSSVAIVVAMSSSSTRKAKDLQIHKSYFG